MEYLPQDRTNLQESELIALLEQFSDEAVHPTFREALLERRESNFYPSMPIANCKNYSIALKVFSHEWSYYIDANNEQVDCQPSRFTLANKRGTLVHN